MSRRFQPLFAVLLLLAGPAGAASIEEQMKIVERIRGLSFTAPVAVETIERDDLPARIQAQVTKTMPYSVGEWETILRALHLIEGGGESGFPALLELYQSQVLAFYDPSSRTYFAVRQVPSAMTALVPAEVAQESVAIHELVHALQDQRFDIGRKDFTLRKDTDAGLAYHAVLEGEATLVMLAHLMSNTGASFDEIVRSDALVSMLVSAASADTGIPAGAPRYYAEMLKFPYLQGLAFVIEAYRRGGWETLNKVHANPPQSTREILHPSEYFDAKLKTEPFKSSPSVPAKRVLAVEHLGEFHWAFLAGADNARGWVNDRVTITENAYCETTTLVETTWESEQAAQRFHDAYTRALDDKGVGLISSIDGRSVRVAYGADRGLMDLFMGLS
jgi:hypothetical protein